ncbi:hypothetical protein EW026_g6614 [Hermanssonia centrifuga]|uniref:Uncharacterized protein n=1 Tax=Hermanssonia centrifuga TaxID=98765 RepID=A0A4V6S0V3_9APHY|nr:hypothetical protein EW026_g6614 [Hermanssonia centrifuga]
MSDAPSVEEVSRTSTTDSIKSFISGGFGGVSAVLVGHPFDLTKTRLQTAAPGTYTGAIDVVQGQGQGGPQYSGVFDVVKHLYKEGGIRSVYRGSIATVARDGPGSAAYFAAYEVTKGMLTEPGSTDLNLGAVIFAGGMAGVAMWSIAIPPDVIKSRIQSAPTGTYSGFVDCIRKTIAADGITALWKGLGPAMARAFPANAATFLGVEASKKLMDKYF